MTEEEIVETLWSGLCGCGISENAVKLMFDVLTLLDTRPREGNADDHVAALESLLGSEEGGVFWWYLYFLDNLDLIEHGSGIRFSWLTEKGDAVLAYLKRHGVDPDEWTHQI